MFYSHTYLARKGPLGTVWCAAHLQHKLKKSHYVSIDITSTVERIMFPEAPFALRMSGHLLLGVVRIYSKKVQYLYNDYNVFLISLSKACSLVEVDLPEGATQAPFHSVTLPEALELDAMDLDDNSCYEGNLDKHLKSLEEITLLDQIPTGSDPYVSINVDEELRHSSSLNNTSGLESRLAPEHAPSATSPGLGIHDNVPEVVPEFESLRENVPVWPDPLNDVLPPDTYMEDQIMDKELPTSVVEETSLLRDIPLSPRNLQGPVNSPASDHASDMALSNKSLGHVSLNLALNPSPPVEEAKGKALIDKPKARPRKRKQRYDEATVLTNKAMKAAIDNCNDIKRKRKCCPSTELDVWKSKITLRKEQIFLAPLITGLCESLRSIYDDNVVSSKPHLLTEKETLEEPSIAQFSPFRETNFSPAPQMSEPMISNYEEIEIPRNYEGPVVDNSIPDGINDNRFNSPSEKGDFTPATVNNTGSPQMSTATERASTGTVGSDWETPTTYMQENTGFGNTALSPILEDMGSAEVDDLNFLATEDNTPMNFKTTEGISSLSGTTRKVAQYLKEKYSPIAEDFDGGLSLGQLLEGKTRKVSARMLFQTLVLKCGEFVDLQQEEAYGDIKLKLAPKLFKDQI